MMSSRVMYSLPIFTIVIILSLSSFVSSQNPMARTMERFDESGDIMSEPRKRPFCNAFTGCGRKRSSPPQQQLIQDSPVYRKQILDESMDTLMSMSSEPAVEELSRQILSEAKLWEAIQEAGAEMAKNRKQQRYTGV